MAEPIHPTPILKGRDAKKLLSSLNKKHSKKKEKFLKECTDVYKEIKHFNQTGTPRCVVCHVDFINIKTEDKNIWGVWKPNCKCFKTKIELCLI